MTTTVRAAIVLTAIVCIASNAAAADVCQNYGPQTPRDITQKAGTNPRAYQLAPAASAMNLCNVHFHKNAEHKGPGFMQSAGSGDHGGYACNDTGKLTPAELKAPEHGGCSDLKPGDTIEVHWVHTSCTIKPGKGLESCSSAACVNPSLRVESQIFLVVNDKAALDFSKFDYAGAPKNGLHQAKALPTRTGKPVVFGGSTTGAKYSQEACSPLQVTWSVRPACAKVDINSLNTWCEKNIFKEDHAHTVRALVTAPQLLSKID